MIAFRVEDMSCDHCVQTIARAVAAVDSRSRVSVDLAHKLVRIDADSIAEDRLRAAIAGAGFTPVAVRQGPGAGAA